MSIDVNQANEGLRAHSRGGIAAVITVNSGAMIALLSQLGQLRQLVSMPHIKAAFATWIVGVVLGLCCWAIATLAASAHVHGNLGREKMMNAIGYVAFFASTCCFAVGAVLVLLAFK